MNDQQVTPKTSEKFRFGAAVLRSLGWGLVVTLLLGLLLFIPGVRVIPYCIYMASVALLSMVSVPGAAFERMSYVATVVFPTLVFAAFRFVHLSFLHQLTNSNARNA